MKLLVGAAASLLGEYAHPGAIAAVAGLSLEQTAAAIDGLAASGLVEPTHPLRFRNERMGEAFVEHLRPGRRSLMYAAAAAELERRGASRELVAGHLLLAPGAGDRAIAEVLVAQGERHLHDGDPKRARRYLERALREPPASDQLVNALLGLARAHLHTGANEAALDAAERALARTADPAQRLLACELAYRALVRAGAVERGLGLIIAEIERLQPEDPNAALRLEIVLMREVPAHNRVLQEALHRCRTITPDQSLEAAPDYELEVAQITAMGGDTSAAEAVELVEPALRLGAAVKADVTPLLRTVWLLSRAEAPDRARELIARISAQIPGRAEDAALQALSGLIELRFAAVPEALQTLEEAAGAAEQAGDPEILSMADAFLALALVEAGADDRLEELLTARPPHLDRLWGALAAVAMARAKLVSGDVEWATATLLAIEEVKRRIGLLNPAGFDHLSYAVIALCEQGELAQATELAELNLERSRSWAAPGTLALAEAAAARTRPAREAVPMLESALERAAASKRRAVEAEVALELGRAQLLANRPSAATDAYRLALDAATRNGAAGLAARAHHALQGLGKRPRRAFARGVESLTDAELRVARLAAAGWPNKRIASTSHLSVRTVENHLRSVYRKLGTDRAGLSELLGGDEPGP